MAFGILIKPAAEKEMDRLPRQIRRRVAEALEELRHDPRQHGTVKLAGEENLWRIRVGAYRVVYAIRDDELLVLVVRVAHRKEVYRGI
jgi:mRNA interferase RelE/StbE